jgi:hypothetical protein
LEFIFIPILLAMREWRKPKRASVAGELPASLGLRPLFRQKDVDRFRQMLSTLPYRLVQRDGAR